LNIVVDTNVLLRILLDDPQQPQQVQAARQLAKGADKLYVPQVVQVESAWMMERGYQLDKSVILKLLTHLQSNEHFVLQEAEIFHDALEQYTLSNVGFADCIILAQAKQLGFTLYTFDKRLAKLAGASSISN
jgi:predicted nucleic-acid-binding protein